MLNKLIAVTVLLAAAAPAANAAVPGREVLSLNGGAVAHNSIDGGEVTAAAALPNGDVVAVAQALAQSDPGFVVELAPDGALDPSFGKNGVAPLPKDLGATQLLAQADGKLLVIGGGAATAPTRLPQLQVTRLNADGSLDASYGTGGTVVTGIEEGAVAPSGAVTGSGELVLAGATGSGSAVVDKPGNWGWAVEELNAQGGPDTTFGAAGIATIPVPDVVGGSLALLPNGTIVTTGQPDQKTTSVIAALNPNGSVDTAFNGGTPTAVPNGGVISLLATPNGEVTLGSLTQPAVARYMPTGALDLAFGGGTVAVAPPDGQLLTAANGEVIYAGSPQPLAQLDASLPPRTLLVTGLTASGTVDPALSANLALPYGGGESTPSWPSGIRPSVSDSFDPGQFVRRADGSYLELGAVGIAEPTSSEGDGFSLWDLAVSAFTPSLTPEAGFGVAAPAMTLSASLPRQPLAADRKAQVVALTVRVNAPGLARITVTDKAGVIARGVAPLWHAGTQSALEWLTNLGRRELRHRSSIAVRVAVTARDLLASAAARSFSATLGS